MKKIKIIAIATICALFVMFLINYKSVNAKPKSMGGWTLDKGKEDGTIEGGDYAFYCPYKGGTKACAYNSSTN